MRNAIVKHNETFNIDSRSFGTLFEFEEKVPNIETGKARLKYLRGQYPEKVFRLTGTTHTVYSY